MTTLLVPQNVLDHYLEHYSQGQRAEIEATYRSYRAKLLNEHEFSASDDRALLMTAGAPGAGKSTHLRQKVSEIAKQGGRKYIRLDSDDIIHHFPSFQKTFEHLNAYFDRAVADSTYERGLADSTNEWLLAARYVADRILNDCVALGLPVAFETTAHSKNIDHFFTNAHKNGYTIELDLCEAPLAVKEAESHARLEHHEAYIDPAIIARKEVDVWSNMEKYAKSVDKLSILWRDHAGMGLTLAATSDGTVRIHNPGAVASFNVVSTSKGNQTVATILNDHAANVGKRRTALPKLVA